MWEENNEKENKGKIFTTLKCEWYIRLEEYWADKMSSSSHTNEGMNTMTHIEFYISSEVNIMFSKICFLY